MGASDVGEIPARKPVESKASILLNYSGKRG